MYSNSYNPQWYDFSYSNDTKDDYVYFIYNSDSQYCIPLTYSDIETYSPNYVVKTYPSIYKSKNIKQYIADIFNIDSTKYVAPYDQSKYLVVSSCFFLVPSVYGYVNQQYFYGTVSLMTSLCSINFWRNANYSYRRTIDHIMAKISFLIYLISGFHYITFVPFLINAYGVLFAILYCYYMSNNSNNTNKWWKYHMMFHLLISYNKMIIIKSVIDYQYLITSCKNTNGKMLELE